MNKESAIKILNSRVLVEELGVSYTVKVTSVSQTFYPEGRQPYRIVNLAAMTPYHLTTAKAALKAGDFDKAANQQLTTNPRIDTDFIPVKGQMVSITLEEFVTKDGEYAIGVGTMSPLEIKKSTKVSLSLEDDDDEILDEAEILDDGILEEEQAEGAEILDEEQVDEDIPF